MESQFGKSFCGNVIFINCFFRDILTDMHAQFEQQLCSGFDEQLWKIR